MRPLESETTVFSPTRSEASPQVLFLDRHVAEVENQLTGATHPDDPEFDYRAGTMFGTLYAPLRPDVTDILKRWRSQAAQTWTWNSDDEYEEEEHVRRLVSYTFSLYHYARDLKAKDHLDLALQARNLADRLYHNNYHPDTLYAHFVTEEDNRQVKQEEPILDKPVYFVIDFDYTVGQTHDAHASLQQAAYDALPMRDQLGQSGFDEIFGRVYKGHKKIAGMHKPEIFIAELAKSLGVSEETISTIYDAYTRSFRHHLYEGAGFVLARWKNLGRSTILTFGDEGLQSAAVDASQVSSVVHGISVVNKKSPQAIELALRGIGYDGNGYVIGVGDRPSDAAAIKAFSEDAVSIRIRHPGAKYSEEQPTTPEETPDYEAADFALLDYNLNTVFSEMVA